MSDANNEYKYHHMTRPDIQIEYDHENRCVRADNGKYLLKRTDVHREHYDMTFEWEDKKLILEIGKGKTMGWLDRHDPDCKYSLKYDDGKFENLAHKLKTWGEIEQLFEILFLCLEKFLIDFPRDRTGFDFNADRNINKSGFANYKFNDLVVKIILPYRPNFIWPDSE